MGILDTYFFGKSMPRPPLEHQLFIGNLLINFTLEQEARGIPDSKLLVLPEEPITKDRNRLAPDVGVFEDGEELVVAIDIAMHHEVKPICDKYLELTEQFPNAEFWIFDFEEEKLYLIDNIEKKVKDYKGERSKYFLRPFIEYFFRITKV